MRSTEKLIAILESPKLARYVNKIEYLVYMERAPGAILTELQHPRRVSRTGPCIVYPEE